MPNSSNKFIYLAIGMMLILGLQFQLLGDDQLNPNAVTGTYVWGPPMILFLISGFTGVISVMTGVGGSIIFVPIVSTFFPFHIDFVRGAGLLIALTGALYAGPMLLRTGLANLRLGLPCALLSSTSAIAGAVIGLQLAPHIVQTALGVTILGVVAMMALVKRAEFPVVDAADSLSQALKISGVYHEKSSDEVISWKVHRTGMALGLFVVIGFLAGLFGIGAGWANVPALNLVLGTPLKVAIGTSKFILSITDTSAAWIYINSGAVIPIVAVPSIAGMILGTALGVRLLPAVKPENVRVMIIVLLSLTAVMALLQGLKVL